MAHSITWHTAQPLWPLSLQDSGSSPARFRTPALLRFLGDDYMQQLHGELKKDPPSLERFVARPESWEQEQAGWLTELAPADPDPLRLFQPAHYRHYLVTAALVCQLPGLPERAINAAQREVCSFVMRRLVPRTGVTFNENDSTTYDEYAWVGSQQQGVWRPVVAAQVLLAEEERLPLFPKTFTFESGKRTLLAGLIPVARREIYQTGGAATAAPVPAAQLQADSFSSEAAATAYQKIDKALSELDGANNATGGGEAALAEEKKISLSFALLDIADYLNSELHDVWQALSAASLSGLSSARVAIYMFLNAVAPHTTLRLREILVATAAAAVRQQIESGSVTGSTVDQLLGATMDRPQLTDLAAQLHSGGAFRDLLIAAVDPRVDSFTQDVLSHWAGLGSPGLTDQAAQDALLALLLGLSEFLQTELPQVWTALSTGAGATLNVNQRTVYDTLTRATLGQGDWGALLTDTDAHRKHILAGNITPDVRVVGERLTADQIAAAESLQAPLADAVRAALASIPLPSKADAHTQVVNSPPPPPDGPVWYRIRCSYERPKCAPVHDPVVSDPSAPFQLAPFFDPAAPIRPIRIQMPEASLDQLRRGAKGVGIATSKELRSQVDRARNAGLKGLIDQTVGGGTSFDFGLVCQLSIPIITICAFILLMIIVQLLNIVFWWIPYFILCLPRIGKKG